MYSASVAPAASVEISAVAVASEAPAIAEAVCCCHDYSPSRLPNTRAMLNDLSPWILGHNVSPCVPRNQENPFALTLMLEELQ